MMITIPETSPLIEKPDKPQHTSKCKLLTLASFVSITLALGIYFSGSIHHESPIESSATHSEQTAAMKLKYMHMEEPFYKYNEKPCYKGAVLEFQSVYHKTYYWYDNGVQNVDLYDPVTSVEQAKEWQDANIAAIEPYVIEASANAVDILVLSEFALNGLVPTREEMYYYLEDIPDPEGAECAADTNECTPCRNPDFADRSTLDQLSCLSKDNTINLVVNYGDIVECETCEDGRYQYNTQIVFDYNGVIIAKYYKIHTYNEKEYDVPEPEDPTTFTITLPSDETTQVTFGIITCYDSMYGSPLLQLVKDEGITNFVMSHWWVNTAPTMNIAMWAQAVSKTYGINLLVAANWWKNIGGATNVVTGELELLDYGARDSSGSGVYSQGEVLADYYNQADEEVVGVLLTGDIPIDITANVDLLPEMPPYIETNNTGDVTGTGTFCEEKGIIAPVNPSSAGKFYTKTLTCVETGFSCTVTAKINRIQGQPGTGSKNWLFMYVFDGYYQQPDGGGVYYYENFCSIAVCDENCYYNGYQGDTSRTVFDSISVTANFDEDATMFVLSADDTAKAVQDVEYTTFKNPLSQRTTVSSRRINKVLLNLSVLGRVFNKDTKLVV